MLLWWLAVYRSGSSILKRQLSCFWNERDNWFDRCYFFVPHFKVFDEANFAEVSVEIANSGIRKKPFIAFQNTKPRLSHYQRIFQCCWTNHSDWRKRCRMPLALEYLLLRWNWVKNKSAADYSRMSFYWKFRAFSLNATYGLSLID